MARPASILRWTITGFVVFLWLVPGAMADDLPLLIMPQLDGRRDDNPTSGYNQLADALAAGLPGRFAVRKLPLVRAVRLFVTERESCFFPSSRETLADYAKDQLVLGELVDSLPVDKVSGHVFTPAGRAVLGPDEIGRLKRLGTLQQTPIDVFLPGFRGELVRVASAEQSLRILYSNRVEAIFGWMPDIAILADRARLPQPAFDRNFSSYSLNTHFVCHARPAATGLLDDMNRQVRLLRESGSLQRILGPHAILADLPPGKKESSP